VSAFHAREGSQFMMPDRLQQFFVRINDLHPAGIAAGNGIEGIQLGACIGESGTPAEMFIAKNGKYLYVNSSRFHPVQIGKRYSVEVGIKGIMILNRLAEEIVMGINEYCFAMNFPVILRRKGKLKKYQQAPQEVSHCSVIYSELT
jgi:hypothetical protein